MLSEKLWIFLLTVKKMLGHVLFCIGYFMAPPFAVAYFIFDAPLAESVLVSIPGIFVMFFLYVWFFDTYEKVMEENS